MRYGPDDQPPAGGLSLYGLQWGGWPFYPVIFGLGVVGLLLNLPQADLAAFASATLLTIGLGSLVQSLRGHRFAVISGPSIIPGLTMVAAVGAGVPRPVAGAVLLDIAGPQIGLGARLWGAGTPQSNAPRLFMASGAVFIALGEAALPAVFFAGLPGVLVQILRNPVVAGLLYIVVFEQLLFRWLGQGEAR